MTKQTKEIEKLAEKLHKWYLEATKKLNPESYNPHAQKNYADLTEEQKFIDRYIANKLKEAILSERQRILEGVEEMKSETQRETGAFKYDFAYDQVKELLNKQQ